MNRHRLYNDLSYLFPVITPPEHYAGCSGQWRELLRQGLGDGRHRILELGVGGGHNLSHLKSDFEATAVDISEFMLDLSRKLNPSVRHIRGDMRTLDLGETFKAVLIHDAVSYLTSADDIRKTVRAAARHLEPEGMLIMAPDYFQETFVDHRVSSFTNQLDDLTVTFFEHTWDPDPDDTEIEVNMFFLLMRGKSMQVEQDNHVLGLFPRKLWEDIMIENRFRVEWVDCPYTDGDYPGYLIVGYRTS